MTKEKNQEFSLKFKRIKILGFSCQTPDHEIPKDTKINFRYEAMFKVLPESDEIATRLKVDAKEKDQITLGTLDIECRFHVENLNQFPKKNDNVQLPEELLGIVISLTFSTARGILYAKGTGTILEKVIMPPIDIRNLIPQFQKQANKTSTP